MIEERKLENVCYAAHRLNCIFSSKYSAGSYLGIIGTNVKIINEVFPTDPHEMMNFFAEVSHEAEVHGYDNNSDSIFESKENFLNSKYLNKTYMNKLFAIMPSGAECKKAWRHYVGLEAKFY